MKQIILSKCFSKVKRVALALFAALCVGNLWGASAELNNSNVRIEDGDFKFTTLITQIDSTSTRYGYLDAEVLNANDEVVISSTRLIDGQKFANKDTSTFQQSFDCVFEGVGTTTECFTIQEFYDKGYCVKLTFNGTKKTSYTELDCPGYGEIVFWRDTGVKSTEMKFAESSSIVDGKLVAPSYPYVSGEYDTTKGITKIVIRYSINDKLFANAVTKEATLNNSDGTYRCEIPAEYASDIINWEVIEYAGAESVVYYRDTRTALQKQSAVMQEDNIEFTWLGTVDNKWDSIGNWSWTGRTGCGYPGKKCYSYYVTKAKFTKNADVDLNGGEYYLWDNNRGFEMSEGITVKLTNGTLGFQPHNDGSAVSLNFGKNNSTIVLKDVAMPFSPAKKTTAYNFRPVAGSTIIMDGSETYYWNFYPGRENTKFYVQNGTLSTSYKSATPGSGSQVVISNGLWIVKTNVGNGLAETTTFRDGPDRQARLWLRKSSTENTYYNLKLYGTYNIKIPETPYSNPYVLAKLSSTNATCTLNIDASDYKHSARVPLIQFKGTLDKNTRDAMTAMTNTASKLVVKANGEDVKAARNAKLVWDETAKILYFQQDSQNAASIGTTEYATLGAALEAAVSGDTVKLLADVVVETVVVVPTGATLDLNGKSIQALAVVGKLAMSGGALKTYDTNTQTYFFMAAPAQTAGALYWTSDAVMTIGADYTLSLDGGSVTLPNSWRSLLKQSLTIKSGATFVIPTGVELNLRGNAVVEEGATLTCEGTIALGNTYDAIDTSATLTSAQLAEGKVTSAVEGYKAIYENGAYKLVEATVTVAPGGAAAVVDTEAAADAVEIAVEVPAGVAISLDAYKAYFTKSVTQNSEGKYEVTAVLKDEVKPVISTTKPAITFEDGKVTVNVDKELPGLYYGVRYATTVEAVETTAPVAGLTVTPAAGDTAGFFKVVVDFAPIPEAE